MKGIWALITSPIRIIVLFLTAGKRSANKQEILRIKAEALDYLKNNKSEFENQTKDVREIKDVKETAEFINKQKVFFETFKASISFIDSMSTYSLDKKLENIKSEYENTKSTLENLFEQLKSKGTIYKEINDGIVKIKKLVETIDTKIEINERDVNYRNELGIFVDDLNALIEELQNFDFSLPLADAKKEIKSAISKANTISVQYEERLKVIQTTLKKIDKFIDWCVTVQEQTQKYIDSNYFAAEKMMDKVKVVQTDLRNYRYELDFINANGSYEDLRTAYDAFMKDAPKL